MLKSENLNENTPLVATRTHTHTHTHTHIDTHTHHPIITYNNEQFNTNIFRHNNTTTTSDCLSGGPKQIDLTQQRGLNQITRSLRVQSSGSSRSNQTNRDEERKSNCVAGNVEGVCVDAHGFLVGYGRGGQLSEKYHCTRCGLNEIEKGCRMKSCDICHFARYCSQECLEVDRERHFRSHECDHFRFKVAAYNKAVWGTPAPPRYPKAYRFTDASASVTPSYCTSISSTDVRASAAVSGVSIDESDKFRKVSRPSSGKKSK
eukprot:GHVR01005208.1.p1 GENE.GHVR01005208.1~~GHVR01005208.1.p1  ORF type:complete len:261 (+),score=70.48 GHVR01005208.1:1-783(+)